MLDDLDIDKLLISITEERRKKIKANEVSNTLFTKDINNEIEELLEILAKPVEFATILDDFDVKNFFEADLIK